MHILVEGFSVFGIEFQYWMPVALLIIAAAVAFAARTNHFPLFRNRPVSQPNQATRG